MNFVTEFDLSYAAIMARAAGKTSGDEDFDIFKCPVCARIYLIEYECGTIFLDPHDMSQLIGDTKFSCRTCAYRFADPVIGKKAHDLYKVTWGELRASEWRWILG